MTKHPGPSAMLPPWDVRVCRELAELGMDYLAAEYELEQSEYSTAQLVNGSKSLPFVTLGRIRCDAHREIVCESMAADTARHFEEIGISPAADDNVSEQLEVIQDAVNRLGEIAPCLFESVATFAWRCHLIQSSGVEFDTSFSDPAIPFSIFVSVPCGSKHAILRTMESIVHEVCHLQLSLYERMTPLFIEESGWTMYSPWKSTERETPGIVHGLYVFKVLQWMWIQVYDSRAESSESDFAFRRIREIAVDVASVSDVVKSPALTPGGHELVSALLRQEA